MEHNTATDTAFYESFLRAHVSRRTLFKAAGAAGAGVLLAQAGLLREAAAESDTVQSILDATVTTEQFDVAFLGTGIENIRQGNFSAPVPAAVLAVLEAARAQEQFHLDFFTQAGGKPLTSTFHLPDPAFGTDYNTFFKAIVDQETRETAAHIAAMNTFVALGRADLVKVAFQYAAEEAEHRLLANYALGVRPANDRAFAQALYATVADYVANLQQLGIIGGTGPAITYPGSGTIDPTNVIERVPGGVAVACAATPTASPSPSASPAPSASPSPAPPVPGLPNTGGGWGAGQSSESAGLLGLLGLGAAAVGAAAWRRNRLAATAMRDDER